MNISVYSVSTQQFILTLKNLKNILRKAEAYTKLKNFDPAILLQTRLFPDMFPLAKQVQTACDGAKFCGARLTHITAPVLVDNEENFHDLVSRIDKTIEYLNSLSEEDFQDFEKKKIHFPWYPGKELSGKDYLVQFALPNFYFHVTTAYNILRSVGLDLGKVDFLGEINWQTES